MKKSVARLGVGGPVGSGKTALLERLLPLLMQQGIEVAVVTNDLLTQEDADRLKRQIDELQAEINRIKRQ